MKFKRPSANGRSRSLVLAPVPLGISVHDHIIVGKNGHASLRGLKLI